MKRQWPAERRIGIGMRLGERPGELQDILDGVRLRDAFFIPRHMITPCLRAAKRLYGRRSAGLVWPYNSAKLGLDGLDAWIDDAIGHIGRDVHQRHRHRQQHHRPLQHRKVVLHNRLECRCPNAVDVEEALGNEGAVRSAR